jgi:branched-chain amino acid transport system substrate-binding protein
MKLRGTGTVTLAAIVTGGLLAGCSSSGSGGGSSGSTSASSAITVGAIGSYSGAFASSQGGIPGVLAAWASSVNAAGGINGHTVKVIAKDAGASAGADLVAAKELISQDHVAAIIDTDLSDSPWLPYARAQKVPVIVGWPSAAGTTDADAFPILASFFAIGYGLLATAKTLGDGAGLAYCAEDCASAANLYQAFAKAAGVSLSVFLEASSSAPDYTAVCQALKDKHVSSYVLDFGSAAVTEITNTCYQQGLRIPQVVGGSNSSSAWKTDKAFVGSLAVDGATPYFESSTPAQKAYRAALSKYDPRIVGQQQDNSWSELAWLSAQLFAAAARHTTGAVTAASITSSLYTLKNETLGGMVQPLNYVAGKPTMLNCYFTWKIISGGKFVTGPDGDKPICVPAARLAPIIAAASKASG